MAKKSRIIRALRSRRNPKFSSRINRLCSKCGRSRAYIRDFDICRICFRELASKGQLPGIKKSSW